MAKLPSVETIKPGTETFVKPGETIQPAFTTDYQPNGSHEGYVSRRVDVKMTRTQAGILRDKLRTLQDSGAKTADGRFVDNKADAVRWILENMGAK
jgi:hypothetical protein